MLVSVVEEEVVEAAKLTKEEIEELAVAVAVEELVALLDLVDKVEILEEDLVQEQVNLVEQVLKPLEVVAVAVVITLVKQVVHLVDLVVSHLATLDQVEIETHLVDLVVEMGLP